MIGRGNGPGGCDQPMSAGIQVPCRSRDPFVSGKQHLETHHFKVKIGHICIIDQQDDKRCHKYCQGDVCGPILSQRALELHQREDISELGRYHVRSS